MKKAPELKIELRQVGELIPYVRNSRTHSEAQVAEIAGSIKAFGFVNPVLISEDGDIIAGHGRVMAAQILKMAEVPCIPLGHLSDDERRALVIADNRIALNAGWDFDMLAVELDALRDADFDISLLGFSPAELNDLIGTPNLGPEPVESGEASVGAGSLADRFMIPPFSVLNAREGWWQDRKRAWLALGIKSELGRGENGFNAAPGGSPMVSGYDKDGNRRTGLGNIGKAQMGGVLMKSWTSHPLFYPQKQAKEKELGRELTTAEFIENHFVPPTDDAYSSGTSIFDPVLCELSYRWFCPPGGLILDPFAGGSVRGIVASKLGRQYVGHELRPEQVAANRAQAADLCDGEDFPPAWIEGDSRNINKTCKDIDADFVFSCPPYADLEVYSDNPADLSTLDYADFRDAYFEIIAKACARLKANRFAAFVVGDVRDKKGNYYDFVGDTVQAFRDAGLEYYNEAILVTAVGSPPIRAGKQFSASRKLGKMHQNVLIFVKGDGKKAAEACGEVEVSDECFAALEKEEVAAD